MHETSVRGRWIEDRYILDTRLRLRKVTESNQAPIYKLGKKYEAEEGGRHDVVTTYLSEKEYLVLTQLPARVARKQRLSANGGSLDIYEHPKISPRIFEIEFQSAEEAAAYNPPEWVGKEITNDSKYSGFALAHGEA